jgi:fumarate reductase subunit C
MDAMGSPAWVAVNAVILVFALIHTVTWILSIPAATTLRFKRHEAPREAVVLASLVAWLAISAGIALVVLRA